MRLFYAISIILFLFFASSVHAQQDSIQKGIQISLLTCGTGNEIYTVFGHSGVRIIDSNEGTDVVYNYGTFDGYDQDFEIKFMRGNLLYYLSAGPYEDFIQEYNMEGRWVDEQIVLTSEPEKRQIQQYLLRNMLPENRAYRYDFFFDNCATRIRDIFTQTHGAAFKYPNVLPNKKSLTFRDIINQYLQYNVWERFGINILLGSTIDVKMSNEQIMFLPDYLKDAVTKATLNGKAFTQPSKRIIDEAKPVRRADYSVLIVLYGLLVLFIVSLAIPKLRVMAKILSNAILVITGLLGVLILIMWYATSHQTCQNNFNLLWVLPTNLLFVFRQKQYKYALVAMCCIVLSFVLHISAIQCLLLPEMLPVMLLLLLVFGNIYTLQKRKLAHA